MTDEERREIFHEAQSIIAEAGMPYYGIMVQPNGSFEIITNIHYHVGRIKTLINVAAHEIDESHRDMLRMMEAIYDIRREG